jgi:hypothetical protein
MIRSALWLSLLAAASPAWADCDHFKWSVAKESEAFAAPQPLPSVSDSAVVGKGYAVTLTQDLALPVKPERDPKPGTHAAVVSLPKLDAGTYQITLSQDAWIDVAQGGKIVKSSDFSGQHDCPTIRKSVRFSLEAGAATVEISNAQAEALNLAVEPAP